MLDFVRTTKNNKLNKKYISVNEYTDQQEGTGMWAHSDTEFLEVTS